MFRIGEFSKLSQVSVRMLRYYDEIGLLAPDEIDPFTGYRMYSAAQLPKLNKIIYLRDSGFNIAEITAALKFNNDNFIVEQLDHKYTEIEKNIVAEETKLKKIEVAKKALLHKKDELHYNVTIKSIPSYHVLSLRKVIPNYYAEEELCTELSAYADQQKITISHDTFSIYHDADYREADVDVEFCAALKKKGHHVDAGAFKIRDTEPVPIMATTMVYGDFANIARAYLAFAAWLQENNQYKMGATSRQLVHCGPWNEENPENYLTEIQIPLEKTSNCHRKNFLDSHMV